MVAPTRVPKQARSSCGEVVPDCLLVRCFRELLRFGAPGVRPGRLSDEWLTILAADAEQYLLQAPGKLFIFFALAVTTLVSEAGEGPSEQEGGLEIHALSYARSLVEELASRGQAAGRGLEPTDEALRSRRR